MDTPFCSMLMHKQWTLPQIYMNPRLNGVTSIRLQQRCQLQACQVTFRARHCETKEFVYVYIRQHMLGGWA